MVHNETQPIQPLSIEVPTETKEAVITNTTSQSTATTTITQTPTPTTQVQNKYTRGGLDQLNHEDKTDDSLLNVKNVVGVVDRFLSPLVPFGHTILDSVVKGPGKAKKKQ